MCICHDHTKHVQVDGLAALHEFLLNGVRYRVNRHVKLRRTEEEDRAYRLVTVTIHGMRRVRRMQILEPHDT